LSPFASQSPPLTSKMLTSLDALGQKTAHPPSFLSTFLGCFIGLGGLAFCEVFLRELCSPAPAAHDISASPPASPPLAGSPAPPPAYLYTADALPNATSIMSAEMCDELGFWLSDHALLFVGSFGALATLLSRLRRRLSASRRTHSEATRSR